MISYWLDPGCRFLTVDGCVQFLSEQGIELWIDHQQNLWTIQEDGRPKFLYEAEDDARTNFATFGRTHASAELRFFDEFWFVRVGDQFIFSAASADEILPFLRGMVTSQLLRVATR